MRRPRASRRADRASGAARPRSHGGEVLRLRGLDLVSTADGRTDDNGARRRSAINVKIRLLT